MLTGKADFMVFGWNSSGMKGVHAAGQLRDYRKMPLLYSAADVFVGTALEEAFGQTLCEASACALPIVAFNVGGVSEVARHDVSARLVDEISASALLHEIRFFMDNPDAREAFGEAGRAIVESEFTLKRQGERWMEYLKNLI
jgi:glycosyltransferase involved in cell wall biosynthesis